LRACGAGYRPSCNVVCLTVPTRALSRGRSRRSALFGSPERRGGSALLDALLEEERLSLSVAMLDPASVGLGVPVSLWDLGAPGSSPEESMETQAV